MLGVVLRWLRTGPEEPGARAFRWPSVGGWSFRTPLTEEGAVPRPSTAGREGRRMRSLSW